MLPAIHAACAAPGRLLWLLSVAVIVTMMLSGGLGCGGEHGLPEPAALSAGDVRLLPQAGDTAVPHSVLVNSLIWTEQQKLVAPDGAANLGPSTCTLSTTTPSSCRRCA